MVKRNRIEFFFKPILGVYFIFYCFDVIVSKHNDSTVPAECSRYEYTSARKSVLRIKNRYEIQMIIVNDTTFLTTIVVSLSTRIDLYDFIFILPQNLQNIISHVEFYLQRLEPDS